MSDIHHFQHFIHVFHDFVQKRCSHYTIYSYKDALGTLKEGSALADNAVIGVLVHVLE